MLLPSASSYPRHSPVTDINPPVDLEACGKEGQVPIRWREHGSSCYTATQAKEEGRKQDGLRIVPCHVARRQYLPVMSHPLAVALVIHAPWHYLLVSPYSGSFVSLILG